MMDSSFQLVTGGSSWLVSVGKIQPSLRSRDTGSWMLTEKATLLLPSSLLSLSTTMEGQSLIVSASGCNEFRMATPVTVQPLHLKFISVKRSRGDSWRTDLPQRSSYRQENNPSVSVRWNPDEVIKSSTQVTVGFSLLLKKRSTHKFLSVFASFLAQPLSCTENR